MPYIPEESRVEYNPFIDKLICELQKNNWNPGHLNYIIYTLLLECFYQNRCYGEANKILGVLTAVKEELYRRHITRYEDEKLAENGDI